MQPIGDPSVTRLNFDQFVGQSTNTAESNAITNVALKRINDATNPENIQPIKHKKISNKQRLKKPISKTIQKSYTIL